MTGAIVDLFAGPGGWDEALRALLRVADVIGVELDPDALATRRAAGHRTHAGDVAALAPTDVALPGAVDGLIASPPCQLYSDNGSRRGRLALDVLAAAVAPMLAGEDVRSAVIDEVTDLLDDTPTEEAPLVLVFDTVDTAERAAARAVARAAALVLEPARWIAALRPRWIALEQVAPVAPLWEIYAGALAELGYSVRAGIVNAADYGVPQTRRRAVLLAALDRDVQLPAPTHAEAGDELAPWIPMAAALDRPAGWVLNTGRDWKPGGSRDDAQTLELDRPAPTVAGAGSQWQWRRSGEAELVSPAELGVLQTFPADYPWAGPRHEQYQQVGNAVPPRLAAHLVAAAAGLDPPTFPEEDRPS